MRRQAGTAGSTYSQSVIYELPFGKNKPWLQQGIGGAVLGGWQTSAVWSADTGQPLFLTASANSLNAPGNTQVPDQVGSFHKLGSIGSGKQWFDTSAFVQPTTAAYGNTPKNGYYGPGVTTFDASLSRTIPIHEAISVQLRADAFNALNHPNFAKSGSEPDEYEFWTSDRDGFGICAAGVEFCRDGEFLVLAARAEAPAARGLAVRGGCACGACGGARSLWSLTFDFVGGQALSHIFEQPNVGARHSLVGE